MPTPVQLTQVFRVLQGHVVEPASFLLVHDDGACRLIPRGEELVVVHHLAHQSVDHLAIQREHFAQLAASLGVSDRAHVGER